TAPSLDGIKPWLRWVNSRFGGRAIVAEVVILPAKMTTRANARLAARVGGGPIAASRSRPDGAFFKIRLRQDNCLKSESVGAVQASLNPEALALEEILTGPVRRPWG